MSVVIPRAAQTDRWCQTRGRWRERYPFGSRRSAVMSCPKCGKVASLHGHSIMDNGAVFPSVVCSNLDCSFHDTVQLENW